MVLWNRSSSLASSGGITSRTGSGTEETFSKQATPAQSSGGGAWNWIKEHSGGIGKVLGGIVNLAGAGIGAKYGGAQGALIGNSIASAGKNIVGDMMYDEKNKDSKLNKFAEGFANKKTNEGVEKLAKGYGIYKDDKLDKTAKLKAFDKLMKSNVADTSNGHVPVGYAAASSQGATVPTGSTSIVSNKKPNKKKNSSDKKKADKKKNSNDKKKASKLLDRLKSKKKNTNKKKK